MNQQHIASSELQGQLFRLEGLLVETCTAFAKAPTVQRRIGVANASKMITALSTENGLFAFRYVLHKCIVDSLSDPEFDSTHFWALVDSINFWDGAHPGRWRLMTEDQRQRWIGWSMDSATEAVKHLLH